jgi:hypothetical protein
LLPTSSIEIFRLISCAGEGESLAARLEEAVAAQVAD